jgi:hypothetical protein
VSVGATVTPVVPTLSKIPPTIIGSNDKTGSAATDSHSCDRYFEEQLTAAEILLVDLGGTAQEITAALGPNGFARLMLQADRNQQVAEVAQCSRSAIIGASRLRKRIAAAKDPGWWRWGCVSGLSVGVTGTENVILNSTEIEVGDPIVISSAVITHG